jgi:Tfp pilus assembly protein PilF
MVRASALALVGTIAAITCTVQTATADTYWVIVQGKVTMEDGSPPPFTVSIERICSDLVGDTPGPLTNKKGEWVWRMEIDPFASRLCVFRASHPGYTSSTTDESNLNLNSRDTTVRVPPLVLTGASADPYNLHFSGDNMPGRAKGPIDKAMKAIDAHNYDETFRQMQAAVAAAPKFAEAWQGLGVVAEKVHKPADARDAYTHAIEADPKLLPPYVTLTRLCLKTKDWQCALNTADSLIKMDTKRVYPEIYLHRAVAQYELKDLAAAEQSAEEFIRQDAKNKKPRAQYILGRILEAKGDLNGAREHMSKYLELAPGDPDAEMVQGHMLSLGKTDKPATEPELEPL